MNKGVAAAVAKRAGGQCEACSRWVGENGELGHRDHIWGRAKAPESVRNVWLLCVKDDHDKTNNIPSAIHWLNLFASHAIRHGYTEEAERAETRAATLRQKFGVKP